ncbi:hypothetical protein MJG53_020239 [Ovis ammon polii x Ovis aries]|uniref:Uncharacterized protein n=1 Tax=Ovis ammon polii x Ovis aries TaxID=2918886 RepID=A0ACB9U1Z8_9CETA|nr:hypothetical protein MJG53_020239 [Ovis ammon polii x Ovis aries]
MELKLLAIMEPKLLVTKASNLLLMTLTVMPPLPPLAPRLLSKPLWKTYPKRKEHASIVRKMVHSGTSSMKNKLKIDLFSDTRRAVVEVDNVSLAAKLVDLPCVIGSLKTLDKKSFYKTADVSQVTDIKQIEEIELPEEKAIPAEHRVLSDIGIPPFPAVAQHIESPDVEKEVKRLLCSDAEAINARWEVIAEDETKEIESQGSIPSYAIASGMSDYKQGHILPEYYMLQEMRNDSSNNTEEDDKEEEEEEEEDYYDEEEEDYYDEDIERELKAGFTEYGQCEAKEGTSSMVMDIQKYTQYTEKKLHEIQRKAQRQKELISKVENLTLKNHLQSVLEQLKLQEEEKTEQCSCGLVAPPSPPTRK